MNIIFWHNILSEHVSPLVKALSYKEEISVYFAYEDSKKRGWTTPDFGKATVLDSRQPKNYNFLLTFNQPTDFHILSGYFSYPIAWTAFFQIRKTEAKILILSEAFEFFGLKGAIRLLKARLQTALWGHSIDGVLAMGRLGVQFYKMAGFPEHKLYEFCYVIEPNHRKNYSDVNSSCDKFFQILYVGKLIPRKRVDLLLKAVADLHNPDVFLTVVGEGRESKKLIALSERLKIAHQIKFLPRMSNDEILELMAFSDLLVLPSRWDGWGAVVSEALSVGTPVICSDRCGANMFVSNSEYGSIFNANSLQSLASKLKQTVLQKHSLDDRRKLEKWSICFQKSCVSKYLVEIITNIKYIDEKNVHQHRLVKQPWL